ncbi:MAG: HNH endonuclease [Actinomycetota bacterium]|nr:HNH endonuclease [Actinomycetota bacterium]
MIDPVVEFLAAGEDGWVASEVVLERVLAAGPGVDALRLLTVIDPQTLGGFARVQFLQAVQAQECWVAAVQQRALVAVAGAVPSRSPGAPYLCVDEPQREEVAAALRLSGATAQARIELARALTGRLPGTLAALGAGEISARHAAAVAEATAALSAEQALVVEARVLPRASSQTVAELRRSTRREVLAVDAAQAAERAARVRRDRHVARYAGEDGQATVAMVGPAPAVEQVWRAVDAAAGRRAAPGDDRTVAARRFDALHAMLTGRPLPASSSSGGGEVTGAGGDGPDSTAGPLPRLRAGRLEVGLVMDLPTALGLAEHPGELPGYGPIPAAFARELAADADWRRLLVAPASGHLLDYGRATYRSPQALADYLTARDRSCVFPGCNQPPWRCEIDHDQPWDAGGATCAGNCGLFCKRHHQLKTAGLWTFARRPNGTGTLTSPTGHAYQVEPHRYPLPPPPAAAEAADPPPEPPPPEHDDPPF